MKRIIAKIALPKEREFEINLQEPGIVHQFLMAYVKKKIAIAMPGMPPGQEMVEEVPTFLVEIDPEGAFRKRKFVVVQDGIGLEADRLTYVGTVVSQASQGLLFHMWEEHMMDS